MKKLLASVFVILALAACTPQQLALARLHGYGYVVNTPARADQAVRHWQRINGLEVDGVVGPDTLASLGFGATATEPADRTTPPAPPPAEEEEVTGPCSEWYATAMAVGWTDAQWDRLKWIMHRESRCIPTARNRGSGSTGLLQIMPMWADDCGGTVSMLFDPTFNLACGVHILRVQGWRAWAL